MDNSKPDQQQDQVSDTIEDILKLESSEKTGAERLADDIATFTGSIFFVWLHVVWFALWIVANLDWWGFQPLDPFPFTFLTMIVSLEAIFLSAFILMSTNRQGRLADRRARITLQVDLIAEREITKLMKLIVGIYAHLGINQPADVELESMQKRTSVDHLNQAAQTAEEVQNSGNTETKDTG